MELAVFNTSGKETGKIVNLSAEVFGIEPNSHVVYLDVKRFLASQRQGTHKAKERNEISGSTRKLHRQKGTGGSRKGSIKSPLFRGGGRIFGPQPRSYDIKVNQKTKVLARKSALTYKAKESNIKIVENFVMESPKTKQYIDILQNLALGGKKTLLILPAHNENIYLSSRNLPKTKVVVAADINTYDLMNADTLILAEGSVEKIEKLLTA